MAKPKEKAKAKTTFQKAEIPLGKGNFLILGIGIIIILIGFYLMAVGGVESFEAVTLAPILLFIGYVIVIPLAILKRSNQGNEKRS